MENVFPEKFMNHVRAGDINPKVREVYESLAKFASSAARHAWITQADECKKAALENEFFTAKEIEDMRSMGAEPHIHNRLVLGVQGTSAVATSQRPDIKVFPLRESDPYLAELVKHALEHVWLKNFGNDVTFDFVEERNLSGIGCVYARRDANKGPYGAVVFKEDDATLWYWDEDSKERDRSDTHLIKAQLRSIQYIKDNYDLKDEEIVSIDDEQLGGEGPTTDTSTTEDNYKRGGTESPPPVDKKRRVWEIEAHMLKTEREHWVVVTANGIPHVFRLPNEFTSPSDAMKEVERMKAVGVVETEDGLSIQISDAQYWPRKLNNRYLRIVVGTKIITQKDPYGDQEKELEEVKNFLGLDSDGDPVLPITFYYGQRLKKAYYRAPTFYALGPNKSLCKRQAQYTLAISKNLSAPPVRESTGTRWKDPRRPDAPGNELLIDKSARVPTRLQPGAIDYAALTNHIEEDKMAIDDAFSLPEVMRGKIPKGVERMSGRLGLALQDTGTIMHNPGIRGLESCLERLGKALLAIILRSWPLYKWQSLVTDDRVNTFMPPNEQTAPESDKSAELKEQERKERLARWENAIKTVTRKGISIVDFNLSITAGSSLPTNRLLKEETAREDYKIGLRDRRAALEYSGDPHAKEIAERMDKREEMLAQMGVRPKKG